MSGFWPDKRVLITGGTGFLGQAVCRLLNRQELAAIAAPSSADYDLRDADQTRRLLADTQPAAIPARRQSSAVC